MLDIQIFLQEFINKVAPNWNPDWNSNRYEKSKWCIQFDHESRRWEISKSTTVQSLGTIYLPQGLAMKVRDILNGDEQL